MHDETRSKILDDQPAQDQWSKSTSKVSDADHLKVFATVDAEYCRAQETPHPGFVVLDSPLLAYRAPEGTEDDLRGTDLNQQFYSHLAAQGSDRQTIVENDDPPEAVRARPQVTMFTGNPASATGYFRRTSPRALPSSSPRERPSGEAERDVERGRS